MGAFRGRNAGALRAVQRRGPERWLGDVAEACSAPTDRAKLANTEFVPPSG